MDELIRKCKDCGRSISVDNTRITFVRCNECNQQLKISKLIKRSKNVCTSCGKEFEKDPHSRAYHCLECKSKIEFKKTHTECSRCKRLLHRDNFPPGNTTICFECRKIQEKEQRQNLENDKECIRYCKRCGKDVKSTRYATVILCADCENKKQE